MTAKRLPDLKPLGTALLETAWPTRCVLCDEPGALLCKRCWLGLPFIDQTLACRKCGGPFGQTQCTECNDALLAAAGMDSLPFASCKSALTLDNQARRIVLSYKDGREIGLAKVMALMMAPLANPAYVRTVDALTYIPDSSPAMARRGFDHSRLLAQEVAAVLGKPCLGLLGRPKALDQRGLGRKERLANMEGAFQINPAAQGRIPQRVLLVDDVITTGATLYAASGKLASSGAKEICCLTFARAW